MPAAFRRPSDVLEVSAPTVNGQTISATLRYDV